MNELPFFTDGMMWMQKISKNLQKNKPLRTNNEHQDFPGGPVVKRPPCNAGDAGSVPGPGTKIPRTAGLLSLRVTTREARLPPLRLNTGK